jgi:hypothetical protein
MKWVIHTTYNMQYVRYQMSYTVNKERGKEISYSVQGQVASTIEDPLFLMRGLRVTRAGLIFL